MQACADGMNCVLDRSSSYSTVRSTKAGRTLCQPDSCPGYVCICVLQESDMGRSLELVRGRAPRLDRGIRAGLRQFLALLLSFALPGTSLPADSLRLQSNRTDHTGSLHRLP